VGRDAEIAKLFELAEGGHNGLLLGPRRYGKTSVLSAVQALADRNGWATVRVDFYGAVSRDEVAARIDEAYRAGLQGPLARWYAGVVRTWSPRLGMASPGGGPRIDAGPRPESDTTRLLGELLELPRGVFQTSGRRCLVVFDEFQALLAADKRIDGLIRSHIQHHRDEASYVFAGSGPGMMAELFDSRERPLFGQARPLRLGALSEAVLAEYVGSRFEGTDRDVGAGLEPLLDLTRGHPQRAMLAAYHLWESTPAGEQADGEIWASAFVAMMRELQEAFERVWEAMAPSERRTLAAVSWIGAWGEGGALYARETLARFGLSKSALQYARRSLLKKGELEQIDPGNVRLVDPLLEAWIASGRRPISS
jgi:hypothetical protein